ncbi:MAG: lysozyme inhibitor LprI family protein [Arenimonas sp.]
MKCHHLFLLVTVLFMAPQIQAASFDCRLAKTSIEKAICSDPALSLLDEKLNVAFKAAREQWNSAAREYVLNDQRAWLKDVTSEFQGQPNNALAMKQLKERYRKRNRYISSPAYPLTGVYNKTNGDKIVVFLDTSERLGVMALKNDLNVVRSSGNQTVDVPIGSIQLNLNLSDGARNALDLCQLRLSFSANRVNVVRKGQCSGADYAGSFVRDQKDNVENYRLNQ